MPGISDLLESDMENNTNFIDENSLISSISDATSIAQAKEAKKPRKRKCVTMPKKPRATKVAVKAEPESSAQIAGTKRKVKAVDVAVDEDVLCETEPPKTKGRSSKSTKDREAARSDAKATGRKQSKKALASEEIEQDDAIPSPAMARSNFATTKATKSLPKPVTEGKVKTTSGRPPKRVAPVTENVVSDPEEEEDVDMVEAQPPRKKARTESRSRQESSYRRRAGSVSDTERGDPLLRRKLGDITRKYENIDMKFRNLKEIAISEANTNFEKLRKEHDSITETTDKLVSSLKHQLAQQAPILQENQKLKKDAQNYDSETKKLRTAHSELAASLAAAQNEIKTLKAKLATIKATPAPAPAPVETKIPASTHKNATQLNKPVNAAGANNEIAQKQQLKLDLYSDLTGLIVRDVKQTEDGDTFDCIQTGRDGRKFFH